MATLTVIVSNIPDEYFNTCQRLVTESDKQQGIEVEHTDTYTFDFNEIGLGNFAEIAAIASGIKTGIAFSKQRNGN